MASESPGRFEAPGLSRPEPVRWESQERQEPRPVSLHLLRLVPMIIIIGLLVHFLLPRLDSVADSLQTMRTMAPWAVAMAIIAETLSYLANGSLLKSVVGLGGERISLARATMIELAAGTVALVAAGALGFGAAIYQWTRKSGVSRETAMLLSRASPVKKGSRSCLGARTSASFEISGGSKRA